MADERVGDGSMAVDKHLLVVNCLVKLLMDDEDSNKNLKRRNHDAPYLHLLMMDE